MNHARKHRRKDVGNLARGRGQDLPQITPEEFPDSDILGAENFYLRRLFNEIETVSLGERIEVSSPFRFHPLWLECTRHAMGSPGRLRYARQVLLVCYHSIFRHLGEASPIDMETRTKNFLLQAHHCKKVCRNFKMPLEDLKLPEPVPQWIMYLGGWSFNEVVH